MCVDVLDVLPRAAAVGRSEQPTITARSPQWAGCCHEYDFRVRWVNDHSADVFRLFQAHVRPRLSTVLGLVYSIAPRRAALVVRFPRADPEDVGIARGDCNVSDGS